MRILQRLQTLRRPAAGYASVAVGGFGVVSYGLHCKTSWCRDWWWRGKDDEVDFVIVGAGSSGCCLAARITEGLPDAKVVLLEAGADDDVPEIQTAVDYFGKVDRVFGSDRDWGHGTEPQPGLGGRGLYWPRGKVIGGCSSFNTMVWMRPDPKDLEDWKVKMDDASWGYDEMLRHLRRAERNPASKVRPDIHGADGPISVARLDDPVVHADGGAAHNVTKTFVEASVDCGYKRNEDFGAGTEGAGLNEVNSREGRRCSTGAYLGHVGARPAAGQTSTKAGGLEVRLHKRATKVLFNGSRAIGVEVADEDVGGVAASEKRSQIKAKHEVILCGGCVNSPQLLLLSGVGPANDLKELGLPVVADVPGVGKHLKDHLHVPMSYRIPLKPHANSNICEGSLFFNLGVSGSAAPPDLQVHIGTLFFEPDGFYPSGEGFTLTPSLIRPKSTGELRLNSADPFDKPVINPGYLSHPSDLLQLREGVKAVRQIGDKMLKRLGEGEEVYPGKSVQTNEEIDAYIRRYVGTMYHPACTCRAGPSHDPLAVLDAEFRVRGVSSLRVCDASAMPELVGANTNCTCVALGEKAAELIVHEHKKR